MNKFINNIFSIKSEQDFSSLALQIFRFQAENNPVYRAYLKYLHKNNEIQSVRDIPFLPVEFFKHHKVIAGKGKPDLVFSSSGTTGEKPARHFVADSNVYKTSFRRCFEKFYGNIQNYCILALLPSYLERKNASLAYMVNDWIEQSNHPQSGFFLDNLNGLSKTISSLESQEQKTILIGVSFALLDLAEKQKMHLKHTTVMETGGMKGRRKELIKTELHEMLRNNLGIDAVHSEYGMTELLSQAYSKGNNRFRCPPWMKIIIRDIYDPFQFLSPEHTGGINVIDLANIHSCAFIETSDLGKTHSDGSFEVLGRMDNRDIRGCNLMVE